MIGLFFCFLLFFIFVNPFIQNLTPFNLMKYLLINFLVIFPIAGFSQVLFGTGGGMVTDSNHQIDFSIGEVIVAEIQNSDHIINVGFQQPYYNFFTSVSEFENHASQLFPNPFSTQFQFNSDLPVSSYDLYDALGKLVYTQRVQGTQFVFDEVKLANGLYSLRVQFQNNTTRIFNLIHK